MIRLWLFLHLLGFTMWLGGALGVMVAAVAARREDRAGLGAVVRAQTSIQKVIVAPGALLTVLSGFVLTFSVAGRTGELVGFSIWLVIMQGAGIVAALLTLLITLPTASKLARVDPVGPHAAYFDELRQRQRVVASISGVLGMVALLAGAMVR
jgi:hypothetical protein